MIIVFQLMLDLSFVTKGQYLVRLQNSLCCITFYLLTDDVACPCFLLIYPTYHASCLYGGTFDGLAICGLSGDTFHHMN